VAIALAGAPIDDLSPHLALAVGVSACVERILEHSNHVAVSTGVRSRPPASCRRMAAEVDFVGPQRHQRLSRVPSSRKRAKISRTTCRSRSLDRSQDNLAMPDVADRHADAQLTTSRFGTGGASMRARSTPSSNSLMLPSCRAAADRLDDRDHIPRPYRSPAPRPAHTAQAVVPIAAIASQPGGTEAQHGPDLAGAQPCYKPLEAGLRHHPAGE